MRLVTNWFDVLRRAWSVRLFVLLAFLGGLDAAWPFISGLLPFPAWVLAVLTILVAGLGIVARVVTQKGLSE